MLLFLVFCFVVAAKTLVMASLTQVRLYAFACLPCSVACINLIGNFLIQWKKLHTDYVGCLVRFLYFHLEACFGS